jgi:hypothetical protein
MVVKPHGAREIPHVLPSGRRLDGSDIGEAEIPELAGRNDLTLHDGDAVGLRGLMAAMKVRDRDALSQVIVKSHDHRHVVKRPDHGTGIDAVITPDLRLDPGNDLRYALP